MRHSHKHNRIWWITIPKMLSKSTKLNNIPAWKDVERKSLEWTISTLVTHLERHRDLADRENDRAVHWSSLCLKLRRAFQSEGAQTFSDSQWLDVLLYVRAIQGHSGGELITWTDESCRQSTQMERIPVSYGKLFQRKLHPTSRTHRKWKGHWRSATNSILHSDPFGNDTGEEFNNDL